MKRLFLCLFFCLAAPFPAAADDPAPAATIRIHSIKADFQQEKHLKILTRPILSTGNFSFQAPQSLRWEYHKPVASLLLMHDGKIRKFIERNGQLTEDKGMPLDSMQIVLAEITNWLDGRFTDNAMFTVSFPDPKTVLLTPKEQGIAALISTIELRVGDQPGLLDAVTIFEGPESFTRLTFSNRALNQELPVSRFTDK